MQTQSLTKRTEKIPSLFNDFFKPWNTWIENGGDSWNRLLSVPAVNIADNKNSYEVSLAAPGLKKDDFRIDVEGTLLIISSEKEESKEQNEKEFTRKEYNYSSFSRSFTLPDEVNKEKIEAKYENGVLSISLPKKDGVKKMTAKKIAVK